MPSLAQADDIRQREAVVPTAGDPSGEPLALDALRATLAHFDDVRHAGRQRIGALGDHLAAPLEAADVGSRLLLGRRALRVGNWFSRATGHTG